MLKSMRDKGGGSSVNRKEKPKQKAAKVFQRLISMQ